MTENPNTRPEDSLAPVELDRLTIEEEVAFMNRGKGKQIFAAIVVVGALAVGGVSAMRALDRQQAELGRGQAVAGLRQDRVDAYLRCVAPTANATALESNDRIHAAIEAVVERGKKNHGPKLSRCAEKLAELGPALARANVAAALTPALRELRTAATDLASGASSLGAYLEDPAKPYDFVQATALIDRVARAVAAYRERDDEFRARLADL